jgi:hypothetical protein
VSGEKELPSKTIGNGGCKPQDKSAYRLVGTLLLEMVFSLFVLKVWKERFLTGGKGLKSVYRRRKSSSKKVIGRGAST